MNPKDLSTEMLDLQRIMSEASHRRVMSVDMHPTEPLILCAIQCGCVILFNFATKTRLNSFEISPEPLRCVKFIVSLNSFCCGGDDRNVYIVNIETSKKVKLLAHEDYTRSIAVHEPQHRLLTCSDDETIKLWDWGRGWRHVATFEGHDHYVMGIALNSKNSTEFASASLDKTVKLWSTTSSSSTYTLTHEDAVNCVEFCSGGEEGKNRSFLISATDGHKVYVWDYASKSCLHVISSIHTQDVMCVTAHSTQPWMFSVGKDGVVGVYSTQTWLHETTRSYGPEKGWAVSVCPNRNVVAVGLDFGLDVLWFGSQIEFGLTEEMARITPLCAGYDAVYNACCGACHDASSRENVAGNDQEGEEEDSFCFPVAAEDAHLLHDPSGEYVAVIADEGYDEATWGQPRQPRQLWKELLPNCRTKQGILNWCLVVVFVVLILEIVLF